MLFPRTRRLLSLSYHSIWRDQGPIPSIGLPDFLDFVTRPPAASHPKFAANQKFFSGSSQNFLPHFPRVHPPKPPSAPTRNPKSSSFRLGVPHRNRKYISPPHPIPPFFLSSPSAKVPSFFSVSLVGHPKIGMLSRTLTRCKFRPGNQPRHSLPSIHCALRNFEKMR